MSGDASQAGPRLRDVQTELFAHRPQATIELFERIISRGPAAASFRMADWVISSIGREGLSDLVLAYATASCHDCSRGRRKCSACDGTGRGEGNIVCRGCLGMRRQPCACCQGTGLARYGECPDELRALVLSYRVCIATSEAAKLVPEENAPIRETTVRRCLRRVANLNKLAGVLESAAVELVGQQARGLISPARQERVRQRIGRTYDTLDSAIRATLDRAVELCSVSDDSQNSDVLFYRWLARSDRFEGTALQRDSAARLASRRGH